MRDGDDYVLNGIKRFTSAAHRAEYVWLAARTDPTAPKHRGISMFLVDLQTPGITVKPIWTMSGLRTNEVYWEDVRVPADALVGEENRGWYYAAHALDFERVSIFTVSGVRAVLRRTPAVGAGGGVGRDAVRSSEPKVARVLADYKVQIEVLQMLAYRNLGMINRGEHPNHEASEVKIFSTELMQRLLHTGTKLLGPYGQLTPESSHTRRWAGASSRATGRR